MFAFITPEVWCGQCDQFTHMRSQHCSICERCVSGFDHHSYIFSTCIGQCNRGRYVLALTLHSLALASVIVWVYTTLVEGSWGAYTHLLTFVRGEVGLLVVMSVEWGVWMCIAAMAAAEWLCVLFGDRTLHEAFGSYSHTVHVNGWVNRWLGKGPYSTGIRGDVYNLFARDTCLSQLMQGWSGRSPRSAYTSSSSPMHRQDVDTGHHSAANEAEESALIMAGDDGDQPMPPRSSSSSRGEWDPSLATHDFTFPQRYIPPHQLIHHGHRQRAGGWNMVVWPVAPLPKDREDVLWTENIFDNQLWTCC